MANEIVISDSGPLIHISEIKAEFVWGIFRSVIIPEIVKIEVSKNNRPGAKIITEKRFKINRMNDEIYQFALNLFNEQKVGKNDSIVLATAIHLKANLLLTDDLDLRELSKKIGITPVGTLGILLRAFRENKCNLEELFQILEKISFESSLYVTEDLLELVKIAAKEFNKYRYEK